MPLKCWDDLIKIAREDNKDTSACVHSTLDVQGLRRRFDNGYGGTRGEAFTYWTETHVYFPIQYDGAEWVGSAPRSPCDIALKHQGGG